MINIDGLISGIDTESIVKGLLQVQQKQIDRLTGRQQEVRTRQAAFQSLEAQILSLQLSGSRLSRAQNSVFDARSISVSHPESLVATAQSGAAAGVYQLQIDSLAAAHQIASQGFADPEAAITQGTFLIGIGSQPQAEITIDATNNTLAGLANAINLSNVGVSASVVHDGSSGGEAYRLLLTSKKTGEAHAISLTSHLADSDAASTKPAFDFDNPVQAATNAQIRLGSGPGALTVQGETNTISNLISGVSLNLLAADPGKTVTVNVSQNTQMAVQAVEELVTTFNGLMDFIDSLVRFDPETQSAGLLLGNRAITDIQNEIRSTLQGVIPGLSSKANRLSSLGITVNDAGRLVLNKAKLEDAVAGRVDGVTSTDLRRLFALDGTSSNGNIEFVLGSSRTMDSTTPYEVKITQAAERAVVNAQGPLAETTVIDGTNNALTLNLDGLEFTVTLAAGEYSRQQLATELGKTINAHPDLGGRRATLRLLPDDSLEIRSDSYGASSRVTVLSGSMLSGLGFNGGESNAGKDVAGYFIVGDQIEEATGRGRLLSGNSGNAHTADLQVRVTLTPAQISGDVDGTIHVTRGLAARLDQRLSRMLNAQTGQLNTIGRSFEQQIESIQSTIDRQKTMFERQQERLVRQFLAMETALSQMQTTSSFLASQLAGLQSLRNQQRN